MHFVVQQKTGALWNHSRAVQIFKRVGVGDSVTFGVNYRKMCRARSLSSRDDVFAERKARCRVLGIHVCPQRFGESFRRQLRKIHFYEVGIAEILRSRVEAGAHGLRQQMNRGRFAPLHRTEIIAFKNVQHLNHGRPA